MKVGLSTHSTFVAADIVVRPNIVLPRTGTYSIPKGDIGARDAVILCNTQVYFVLATQSKQTEIVEVEHEALLRLPMGLLFVCHKSGVVAGDRTRTLA